MTCLFVLLPAHHMRQSGFARRHCKRLAMTASRAGGAPAVLRLTLQTAFISLVEIKPRYRLHKPTSAVWQKDCE